MTNGWKVVAIILIIIQILEIMFFMWAWNYSSEMTENENECVYNICFDYPSYYYDYYEQLCYCYEDGEIKRQEYIK